MIINIPRATQESLRSIPRGYPKPPFRCAAILLLPESRCHRSGYGVFSAIFLESKESGYEVVGRSEFHDAIRFRRGEDDYDMDLLPNVAVFRLWPSGGSRDYAFSVDIPGISDVIVTTVKK